MITTIGATDAAAAEPQVAAPTGDLDPDRRAALERLVSKREQLDPEHRALIETMAKQYKIPMSPKAGFSQLPNLTKEGLDANLQAIKQSALPIGGQIAGMTASQVLAPGNVPLALTLGGIGGVVGTKGNEMLGISKPDELDYLLGAMSPAAGAGLMRAGRRAIPGVAAAEQQLAMPGMKTVPSLVSGGKAETDAAYQRVRDLGQVSLDVPNFAGTVDKLLANEQNLAKYGEHAGAIKGRLNKTANVLLAQDGKMPFEEVSGLLKRYRERVASAESKGGEQYGLYKDLRKSLFTDMDTAVARDTQGAEHVKALRQAMGAAKRRIAQEELSDIVGQYGTKAVTVGGQTFEVIEPTKVLNKLKDIGWTESVGKQEANKVEQALKELAKVPHPTIDLRSGMGQEGRLLATAGATVAGAYAGGPLGAAGTAAASYGAFKIHDAIAKLAMSDPGREFLVKMFRKNGGRMGERTGAIIQFAADQFQDPGE